MQNTDSFRRGEPGSIVDADKEALNPGIPIVSGDQCSWWDSPIKLAVIRDRFPQMEITHHIQDADTLGAPTKEFSRNVLVKNNLDYAIAREPDEAKWTSGVIKVPGLASPDAGSQQFTGLVARNAREILASFHLDKVPLALQILNSRGVSPNGTHILAGSFSDASAEILTKWLAALAVENIRIGTVFDFCLKRRQQFMELANGWRIEHTEIYNQCAQALGMRRLSRKKSESPFFLVFNEGGKLIRRDAYLRNGSWLAYKRNKPRPVNIDEAILIIPKALLLGVIVRSSGYLVLPKTGSNYINQTSILADIFSIRQYPIIEVDASWRGIARPFVGWIHEKEGPEGLRKLINNATVQIRN